jgi:hypothetical protein
MTPNEMTRELARIANARPELARDLRGAHVAMRALSRAQRPRVRMASESLHETLSSYCSGLARVSQKIDRKSVV